MNQLCVCVCVCACMCACAPPFWAFPAPPLQVITERWAELLVLDSSFPVALYFPRGVFMSNLISQFIPPSHSPCVCTSVLYVCVSVPALELGSSVLFSIFHIHALIYNICFFSFWLPSLCMTDSRSINISTNDPTSFLCPALFFWWHLMPPDIRLCLYPCLPPPHKNLSSIIVLRMKIST